MKKQSKKVKVCVGILFVMLIILMFDIYNESISNTGTFTNDSTDVIQGDIKYNTLDVEGLTIQYPEYCEVTTRGSGSFDIVNTNSNIDEVVQIYVDTNLEPTYPFNKMSFKKLPYIFVKYTYRFKPREDAFAYFYRLENINDKWTMVFYEAILTKDNEIIYNCQYDYINDNNKHNTVSVMSTDSLILFNVIGTIEY